MWTLIDSEVVLFDVETTDTSLALAAGAMPSIVEIGAVRFTADFEVVGEYSSLVQPPNLDGFTEMSRHITGIEPGDLAEARPWLKVWREFAEFTDFNLLRLMAWHAPFDTPVLRAAYGRDRLGFPHEQTVICAAALVYGFCCQWGIKPRSWKLAHVCERFEVPHEKQHRALPDARAAMRLLQAVAEFEDTLT